MQAAPCGETTSLLRNGKAIGLGSWISFRFGWFRRWKEGIYQGWTYRIAFPCQTT